MYSGNRRKSIEREERKVLREQREDEAGKLIQKIPDLTSLCIDIRESRSNGTTSETQYTRRVVIEHAHALFEMPCSFAQCTNGGYDVTREILDALASHKTRFKGECTCRGSWGTGYCPRVLHYVATATYRAQLEV